MPEADSVTTREALLELGTATLGETGASPLAPRIRAVWPGARFAAPAFPVSCSEGDNLAIHVAVARAPAGTALAVDVGNERERGFWGEVLTVAARARGLVGLVIDGGVRDSAALAARDFPVFATTIALRGASKERRGAIGAPARVGGVLVRFGDWMVADADGAALVPAVSLDTVLQAGRVRAEREQELFSELRAGRTTLELLGLDASRVAVE